MRAHGKARGGPAGGFELSELTITANPEVLRELAKWMLSFADELQKPGYGSSHVHFREEMEQRGLKVGRRTPDVILCNPRFH